MVAKSGAQRVEMRVDCSVGQWAECWVGQSADPSVASWAAQKAGKLDDRRAVRTVVRMVAVKVVK